MEEKQVVVVSKAAKFRRSLAPVLCACLAASFGLAGTANAALTFTGIELNTADVESVMMLVIPALAALWGFRKIVKTMNRS